MVRIHTAAVAALAALGACDAIDWTDTASRWVWAACNANDDLTCDDPPEAARGTMGWAPPTQ